MLADMLLNSKEVKLGGSAGLQVGRTFFTQLPCGRVTAEGSNSALYLRVSPSHTAVIKSQLGIFSYASFDVAQPLYLDAVPPKVW